MASHLNKQGVVHSFTETEIPGYAEWFFRWRELRNRAKEGVNFGSTGDWNHLRITFSTIIPEGRGTAGGPEAIGLAEIIEALEMSSRLHGAIRQRAERALAFHPEPSTP